MDLKAINKKMFSAMNDKQTDYYVHYLDNAKAMQRYLNHYDGVTSDFEINSSLSYDEYLKFLLVFSDVVSIYTSMGNEGGKILIPTEGSASLTIPNWLADEFSNLDDANISVGYVTMLEDELKILLHKVKPFYDSGRVAIRPIPIVMKRERDSDTWNTFNVDMSMPTGDWFVTGVSGVQNSIPFSTKELNVDLEEQLFDIALPYITGIGFDLLNKVLESETDQIAIFRKSMKETLDLVQKEGNYAKEIRNDILRPEIEKLNRQFRTTLTMNSLKIGGATLGTVALSLMMLNGAGWTQSLYGLFGAGGLGLLSNEVANHIGNMAELKNNPYYLLWKLNKKSNK